MNDVLRVFSNSFFYGGVLLMQKPNTSKFSIDIANVAWDLCVNRLLLAA